MLNRPSDNKLALLLRAIRSGKGRKSPALSHINQFSCGVAEGRSKTNNKTLLAVDTDPPRGGMGRAAADEAAADSGLQIKNFKPPLRQQASPVAASDKNKERKKNLL
ncbi:hypothetical protein CDAR_593531 [Caerostris darwini]|uniref:Uncharacterized protein n=1 Tax=Caerostris darwini TaxID=1538125 RepID=A0AAV4S0J2_9ARAC|nr:hypothetical protein CDAR_593531 [Caerostris darwini]